MASQLFIFTRVLHNIGKVSIHMASQVFQCIHMYSHEYIHVRGFHISFLIGIHMYK